mgnify:FL=1
MTNDDDKTAELDSVIDLDEYRDSPSGDASTNDTLPDVDLIRQVSHEVVEALRPYLAMIGQYDCEPTDANALRLSAEIGAFRGQLHDIARKYGPPITRRVAERVLKLHRAGELDLDSPGLSDAFLH